MSESKPKQQQQPQDHKCEKCQKLFKTSSEFNTHIKIKHPEEQPTKKDKPKKNNLQHQQNQLEDNIYAYLGELGEVNIEPHNHKSNLGIPDENHKLTGQTNYSVNKVVRTPYQPQIEANKQIPHQLIQNNTHQQFLKILGEQLNKIYLQIEQEREKWELRDPMAPEEEVEDQFSLMNIPKLIKNYPRRKLNLTNPQFSIFLLWIARICKPPAWKQFFITIGTFLALYQQHRNISLKQFWKNLESNKPNEIIKDHQICNESQTIQIVEYFIEWTQLFALDE